MNTSSPENVTQDVTEGACKVHSDMEAGAACEGCPHASRQLSLKCGPGAAGREDGMHGEKCPAFDEGDSLEPHDELLPACAYENHLIWLSHRAGLCAAACAASCCAVSLSVASFLWRASAALIAVATVLLVGSVANGLNVMLKHELFSAANPECADCPPAKIGEVRASWWSRIVLACALIQAAPWVADAAAVLWHGVHADDLALSAANVLSAYLLGSGLIRCFLARVPEQDLVDEICWSESKRSEWPDSVDGERLAKEPRARDIRLPLFVVGCVLSVLMWVIGYLMVYLGPIDIMRLGFYLKRFSWLPVLACVLVRVFYVLFERRR